MKRFGLLVHDRAGSYLYGGLGSRRTIAKRALKATETINISRLEVVPVRKSNSLFGLALGVGALMILGLAIKKKHGKSNRNLESGLQGE